MNNINFQEIRWRNYELNSSIFNFNFFRDFLMCRWFDIIWWIKCRVKFLVIRLRMLLLQHFHDTCSIFLWQKELCTMTWKMFTWILENEIYISLKHQNDWESIFDTITIILSADQFIIMIIIYRRFLFWP